MESRKKRVSRRRHPGKLRKLTAAAATFDHRTRIVENSLDLRKGAWRLGFDNGYALILCVDGTFQIVRH